MLAMPQNDQHQTLTQIVNFEKDVYLQAPARVSHSLGRGRKLLVPLLTFTLGNL